MVTKLRKILNWKTIELKNLDEVGSDCYEEKFLDILKLTLIFKSLLCKDINSPECYTQEEIIKLLEILKFECNNCCSDIKGLKKQLLWKIILIKVIR